MTTYEHAMLGINGALATGLHRRHGWKIVALASAAAIAPDWDGLPMLIDMAAYESGHRVWGHNLLACLILAVLLGTLDYRFDISGRLARRLVRFGPFRELEPFVDVRRVGVRSVELPDAPSDSKSSTSKTSNSTTEWAWIVWIVVPFVAAISQIPADAVVSGGKGLSDWPLQPLWPFSDVQFVYPMVPWGNVGVTIIFAIGMLAMVRWKNRVQSISVATLCLVATYIFAWGVWVR